MFEIDFIWLITICLTFLFSLFVSPGAPLFAIMSQMTKEKMLRQAHAYLLLKRSAVIWPRSHLEFYPPKSVPCPSLPTLQQQDRGWFALRTPDAAMSSRPLMPWVSRTPRDQFKWKMIPLLVLLFMSLLLFLLIVLNSSSCSCR